MMTSNAIDSDFKDPSENALDPEIPKNRVSSRRRSNREEYWADFLKRQAQSTLTIKEFCCQEGVSTWSFYTWRRRFRSPKMLEKRSNPMTREFVELLPTSSDSGIHVDVGDTFRVVIARRFDPETLRVTLRFARECVECCR